jgi:hypothetical protein
MVLLCEESGNRLIERLDSLCLSMFREQRSSMRVGADKQPGIQWPPPCELPQPQQPSA